MGDENWAIHSLYKHLLQTMGFFISHSNFQSSFVTGRIIAKQPSKSTVCAALILKQGHEPLKHHYHCFNL